MNVVFVDSEITSELIYSMPSNKIMEVAEVVAVEHPETKDLIVLKSRGGSQLAEQELKRGYVRISKPMKLLSEIMELSRKAVVLEHTALNIRGQRVLKEIHKLLS